MTRTDREKFFIPAASPRPDHRAALRRREMFQRRTDFFFLCSLQTLNVVAKLRTDQRNHLNGQVRTRERQFVLNQSELLLVKSGLLLPHSAASPVCIRQDQTAALSEAIDIFCLVKPTT